MTRTLTATERTTFEQDGVVHLPAAIGPAWVEEMTAAVNRQLASPGASGTGMDRHLYPYDPEFRSFVFDTGLARLAADAMGSDTIRIYFDQIFVKDGRDDRPFAWHQDHPFWPIRGTKVASTWVALTSSTVEGSSLEFVKGSHRWGIDYRPFIKPGQTVEELNELWPDFGTHVMGYSNEIEAFEEHPERYEVIGFAVEPGDALLFDYRILHRSRGNATDDRRAAVSYRWLGDDAVWAWTPGADPVIGPDDTSLAPGDPITDDATFPVVFSRQLTSA
jgi:ectoine hydroxylase-related dioxygenase (phytanoyl-CoA dioxygenase family)